VRRLAELRWPVFLTGRGVWDPAWSDSVPLVAGVPQLSRRERAGVWQAALAAGADLDPVAATTHFRLDAQQIARAARAARLQAAAEGRPATELHVTAGARAQNAVGLEAHARRIVPRVGWEDLVLPAEVMEQLAEITARLRHRERVLDEWRMARTSSRGRGITALFAGDSGTGKTMSAEVIAGGLGLDLYVIDLSSVLDKYIGETEKNLDRIFTQAEGVGGVLLFDEADALFGKRSEVKDSHDRYANVEVAYLLQRMERFDGIALLTTNLRTNLDDAFTRRLDAIIEFPLPSSADRRALWAKKLDAGAPLADDIDLDFLAEAFRISGGNIHNSVVTAAFLAAQDDRSVSMGDLIRGVQREYRKLGRLALESEFGPYFPLVRAAS
jgi:ATPase family protein associated with various cellular activities (AAA)